MFEPTGRFVAFAPTRPVEGRSAEDSGAARREAQRGGRDAALERLLRAEGAPAARRAAGALHLPERGRYVCLAAPVAPGEANPLRGAGEALERRGMTARWARQQRVVAGLVLLGEAVRESLVAEVDPLVNCRAAVSPVVDDLGEVPAAHRLALAAARSLHRPRLVTADDRLPEALLLANPDLTERFPEMTLGALLELPQREREPLLGTLEALLRCNGSATHAAKRLYCHRNTVLYRLQRIESLTGRALSRSRDRLLLSLGLMTLRLSDAEQEAQP
ncbi:PucR family transcriptional regulator [Saccharopolyspora griseoalba]|uniref:PucR family transcriptional regulator n=1 Tax=Saccharopolyspora griseoalba TaxID=1431848 RepID=A0ABW2LRG4_9PSEU